MHLIEFLKSIDTLSILIKQSFFNYLRKLAMTAFDRSQALKFRSTILFLIRLGKRDFVWFENSLFGWQCQYV